LIILFFFQAEDGIRDDLVTGAFSGQLSPRKMAAVITYERNAWGNNSGEAVQPADVASHGQ